ncbi:MAG: SDR family oxidoreductase [Pseudomonadota bacterium]
MESDDPSATPARVIVTGASGGIGGAIAQEYLACGADVVNIDQADNTQNDAHTINTNIAEAQSVAATFAQIDDRWDGAAPDVFVGCAAISRPSHLLETAIEDFDAMVAINVRGTFITTQAAARRMAAVRAGSIVLISSVAAFQAWADEAVYSATKAATSSLVQGFANDLAPFGVRVNAVAPGPIEHPAQTMATTRSNPDVYRHEIERTPLSRLGGPEEVAKSVRLLAQAPWVTGQILCADGGFIASGLSYFGKARDNLLDP